jgi:hypothetical protein
LSRFLRLFLHLRQISNAYTAIPPSLRFGGQSAPLLFQNSVYLDLRPVLHKPCTATLVKFKKLCTRMAKTAPCFAHSGLMALSFLPGHYFPAFIRSATLTPFIAGPLAASCVLQSIKSLTTAHSI